MNWRFPYFEMDRPVDSLRFSWHELEQRFKWVADMKDVPQDPIYHAEGNVAIHTRMVLMALMRLPEFCALDDETQHVMFLAALMHDMEQRSTTRTEDDGRITSKGHARKGESSARKEMYTDLLVPFHIREKICKLVRYHGLPLWVMERPNPTKEVIEASLYLDMRLLSIIARADAIGRTCDDKEELLYKIQMFDELCKESGCLTGPRLFGGEGSRFHYLNRGGSPDYVPFDSKGPEAIIMMGIPGSGKNTYIKNNFPGMPCVSIDDIRKARGFDRNDSTEMGHAIQETKEEMKKLMRTSAPFVYNATNLTKDMRSKVLSSIHEWKNPRYKTRIIYLEVPYVEILRRNSEREWKVPEDVINKMMNRIELPGYDEAHSIELKIFNS